MGSRHTPDRLTPHADSASTGCPFANMVLLPAIRGRGQLDQDALSR